MARSKANSKKSGGRGRKRKGAVSVDFEGVESGGRTISDGWAQLAVKKVELKESESGNEMFATQFEATRGKEKAIVYENFVLVPQALWKLKSFLEASGVEVPDGAMDLTEDDFDGLECEGEIVNEEYEGRDRPRIVNFRPLDGEEDEEEEEEEEEEQEEDEEEEQEEDEGEEQDEDEDEDEDEEEEEEEPKKGSKKSGKSKSKLKAGQRVKFKDEDGKTIKGVITGVDDDIVYVEDSEGDEWELDASEVKSV